MRNKFLMRAISGFTAVIMMASLLSGCGGQKSAANQGKAADGTKVEAPTEISIMVPFFGKDPIDNTNVIWKEVEKRTNTKLNVTFVPQSNYDEKMNVTVASGSMPDIIQANSPMASNVMTAAMNGAFWEVGKYLKDYPELMKYPEIVWQNTKYLDGKNYAIPRCRSLEAGGNVLVYRKDWLEKLNMKVPETLDDIYNMLKAFVDKDPDGNGQKDTIGLVGYIAQDGTNLGSFTGLISTAFGGYLGGNGNPATGYFHVKDGTLQSALTTPELKQAIAWLKKLYADGLIHKDFAVMKQQQERDAAMSGKVGATTENVPGSWVTTEGLRKVDPKGTFVSVPYLVNPKGQKYYPKGSGYNGAYLIRKQDVDEAKLKKLLGYLNKTSADDIFELANYGIKDVHFTKNGNVYVPTEQAKKETVGTIYMGAAIACKYDKYLYAYNAPNITQEAIAFNMALVEQMEKVSVANPMDGLISATWSKYQKEYDKKVTDQVLKIMLGADSLDNWDAFASKMASDANYKKSLEELQAAYKVKIGK